MIDSFSKQRQLKSQTSLAVLLALVILLILTYSLMVSSAIRKSPTVDEQSHLFRGVAYLKTGSTHFLLGHPLLASTLAALPLLTEMDLRLPVNEAFWDEGNWSLAGDAFLWRLNENPQRLIFLGRLVVIWETLFLGALLFRWGTQLAGTTAGLLAASLLVFDPNVLAHGRLVTNDVPITLFFTLTIYGYWRWAERPNRGNILLTGIGLGLASVTKYNAALLLPILVLQGAGLAWRRKQWRPLLVLPWVALVGGVVIWSTYRFALHPLPGGAFWDDLYWTVDYFSKPHGSYLLGQFSADGWWTYFPVAFLLKTPVPSMLLLIGALLIYGRSWSRRRKERTELSQAKHHLYLLFLLLPACLYFLISLSSSINIGYRYLLPVLPFLYLFSAGLTVSARYRWGTWMTGAAAAFLIITSLRIWPDYIPYFNLLAGGTGNGWRLLSDSNVDWGQDLPALAEWQQERANSLKLSYFGTAHPSAFGIDAQLLPTWAPAPEQAVPGRQPFNPTDPAPGIYAISVTNLHGVVLGRERDAFAWFEPRQPLATIGGSIFVYEVMPRGDPVDVAFSGLRPADLSDGLHAVFETNDVRVRWFDAETSFVWPQNGGWAAIPKGQKIEAGLTGFWPARPYVETSTQSMFQLPAPPDLSWSGGAADLDGVVGFLGYEMLESDDHRVSLLTAWRVLQTADKPLKIFIHALDPAEQIVGQWDGLHVDPANWRPGDVFVQFHSFDVPQPPASEPVPEIELIAGMYESDTGLRLSDPIRLSDRDSER